MIDLLRDAFSSEAGKVLLGVLAGGFITYWVERYRTDRTIEDEWKRRLDQDLRVFQEAVIDLVEKLGLEYADAQTSGLGEKMYTDTYYALSKADMLYTRVSGSAIKESWNTLRSAVADLHKSLQQAEMMARETRLDRHLTHPDAKATIRREAEQLFTRKFLLGLPTVIELNQAFSSDMERAFRQLAFRRRSFWGRSYTSIKDRRVRGMDSRSNKMTLANGLSPKVESTHDEADEQHNSA